MPYTNNQDSDKILWVPHAIGVLVSLFDFFALPTILQSTWHSVREEPIVILVYVIFIPFLIIPFWYVSFLRECWRDNIVQPIRPATPLPPHISYKPIKLELAVEKPKPIRKKINRAKPPKTQRKVEVVIVPNIPEPDYENMTLREYMPNEYLESYIRYVVKKGYCSAYILKKRFKLSEANATGSVLVLQSLGLLGPRDACGVHPLLLKPEDLAAYFLPGGYYKYENAVNSPKPIPLNMDDVSSLEQQLAEIEKKISAPYRNSQSA